MEHKGISCRFIKTFYIDIFLSILLSFYFCIPAGADTIIAVAPFRYDSSISEIFSRSIAQFEGLTVIPHDKVKEKINLLKISDKDLMEPLKILDLGRILNANLIVFGAYYEFENTIKISSQIIDVYSGSVKYVYQIAGFKNDFDNILSRFISILFKKENYYGPEKVYAKIEKQPENKIYIKYANFSIPETDMDNADINEITFDNFISYKTNFVPFFWLDNNIEIIGKIAEKNGENIAIFDANKGCYKILQETFLPYPIRTISLSPDKKKIAYESNGDVFILNIDGSEYKKIDFGSLPSWAPDSRRISYIKGIPPQVYYINVDKLIEPVNLVKGTSTLWLPGGNEIVINYNLEGKNISLTSFSIDRKIVQELSGNEAINYYYIFGSNSFSGPRIPVFSRRNWIITKTEKKELKITDIKTGENDIIKIKGKQFIIDAGNILWSKNGMRIVYTESRDKLTVAEIGIKDSMILKLNVGATDGLSENDKIDFVSFEKKISGENGKIYQYQENIIDKVKIVGIYPKVSIAIIPNTYDIGQDKIVKYILYNDAGMEGTVIYCKNNVTEFLKHSKNNAALLFKSANKFFDDGNFEKTRDVLKKIIDIYPETPYYLNAKDMMKLLPARYIIEE
ncbi:hypothetical protein HY745_14685 [Candidatus Desantisbacteria bacterium]|nr:hypothetical protein [Candidatus Desantisbacteria bacterium]